MRISVEIISKVGKFVSLLASNESRWWKIQRNAREAWYGDTLAPRSREQMTPWESITDSILLWLLSFQRSSRLKTSSGLKEANPSGGKWHNFLRSSSYVYFLRCLSLFAYLAERSRSAFRFRKHLRKYEGGRCSKISTPAILNSEISFFQRSLNVRRR